MSISVHLTFIPYLIIDVDLPRFVIAAELSEPEQNPDELTNEEGVVVSENLHAANTEDIHAAVIRLANSATNIHAINCSILSSDIISLVLVIVDNCRYHFFVSRTYFNIL